MGLPDQSYLLLPKSQYSEDGEKEISPMSSSKLGELRGGPEGFYREGRRSRGSGQEVLSWVLSSRAVFSLC
jgi:hypothetical protein